MTVITILQEAFDISANHLLTQGEPSYMDGSTSLCAYRGENGKMCAIGALIPDDEYQEEMEYKSVDDLFDDYEEALPSINQLDRGFLATLQRIHDVQPVEFWPFHLKKLADNNGLTTENVKGLKQ